MVDARVIGPHPAITDWAEAACPAARAALTGAPRRAGGTWTVGLDLLPNEATGRIAGVNLPWDVLGLDPVPLHRAQLSTIHPGYPRPDPAEPDSAHRYRLTRASAHLDGLLPIGPEKRRMIREPHAWILGLPLTDVTAAPLVVWPGSAALIRAALHAALAPHPPERWGDIDVTDAYQTARRRAFDTCPRVDLPVTRGQATLLHRLTLHGVAPWGDAAGEARIIAYFRPQLPSVARWLAPDTQIGDPQVSNTQPPAEQPPAEQTPAAPRPAPQPRA